MGTAQEVSTRISGEVRPTTKEQLRRSLQDALVTLFGKTFNAEVNQTEEAKVFDEQVKRNMKANCGRVSSIVQKVVAGDIREISAKGENPEIIYKKSASAQIESIASGFATANHRFVVDQDNRVWDPITEEWGTTPAEVYKKRFCSSKSSKLIFAKPV